MTPEACMNRYTRSCFCGLSYEPSSSFLSRLIYPQALSPSRNISSWTLPAASGRGQSLPCPVKRSQSLRPQIPARPRDAGIAASTLSSGSVAIIQSSEAAILAHIPGYLFEAPAIYYGDGNNHVQMIMNRVARLYHKYQVYSYSSTPAR